MEKIIGYRLWKAGDYSGYRLRDDVAPTDLFSCGVKETWKPGTNHANCKTSKQSILFGVLRLNDTFNKHKSPAAKCTCGFWAFKDLNLLRRRNEYKGLGGMVLGSGKIISHAYGFRAEKMEVLALFPNWEFDVSKLIDKFAIPIMNPEHALLLAKEKGGVELDNIPEEWKIGKIKTENRPEQFSTGRPLYNLNLPLTYGPTTNTGNLSYTVSSSTNALPGFSLNPVVHQMYVGSGVDGRCPNCNLIPAAQPTNISGDAIEVTCTCGKIMRIQRI